MYEAIRGMTGLLYLGLLVAVVVFVVKILRGTRPLKNERVELRRLFLEVIEKGEAGDMQPWGNEPWRDFPYLELGYDVNLRERYEVLTRAIQGVMARNRGRQPMTMQAD